MKFQFRRRSECCRRLLVIWACRRKIFISGTKTSKKAENVLMTWNASDDHQHQLTSNTPIKSKNKCTKIVDWQLETLLTLLTFQEDHSTPFQKIFWADNSWFCITIMRCLTLHSFFVTISPKTQRISFHNNHIRLIWFRVTSGYFPNSKAESKKALKAIPEIEFNKCFGDWKKRCQKCIISGGDYFEGDEIDLDK